MSRIRSFLFKAHTWLGLHIFAVMGLVFLTGSLAIFMGQIEAFLDKDRRMLQPVPTVERASFGTIYDAAKSESPQAIVVSIERGGPDWIAPASRLWSIEDGFYRYWHGDRAGSITGRTAQTDLGRVVIEFHTAFLTGRKLGEQLVTSLAFLLLFFIVSGLVTYRRFWRGFFRLPSSSAGARGWWGGLHRLIAIWSLPFLLITAITSAYFFISSFGLLVPQQAPPIAPPMERQEALPSGFDGSALDALAEKAGLSTPGIELESALLPGRPTELVRFSGGHGTVLFGTDRVTVHVDPLGGQVLHVERHADKTAAQKIQALIFELHFGTFGDSVTEWLWLVFGLATTALTWAGAMIYASRRADQSRPALARIWAGMSPLRWTLPAFALAVVAVGFLRFT